MPESVSHAGDSGYEIVVMNQNRAVMQHEVMLIVGEADLNDEKRKMWMILIPIVQMNNKARKRS
jgi:hypothetical protein